MEILVAAGTLAGIGASLLGVSQIAGAKALKPPVPDFRYQDIVNVSLPSLPDLPQDALSGIVRLRLVINLVGRFSAGWDALGKIHSKLLGAEIDGNKDAMRVQLDSYRAIESLIFKSAAALGDAVAEAVPVLEQIFVNGQIEELSQVWREEGIPYNIRKLYEDSGYSKDDLEALETVGKRLSLPLEAPINLLYKISIGIASLAQEIQMDTQQHIIPRFNQ